MTSVRRYERETPADGTGGEVDAKGERAAIVAWLRYEEQRNGTFVRGGEARTIADYIEAEVHGPFRPGAPDRPR